MIIREAIIAEIRTRLEGISGVTVSLMPAAEPDLYPWVAIDDGGQRVLERDAFITRYTLTLSVEGAVQAAAGSADPGADAHGRLNTLYAAIVRAVLADPRPTGVEIIDEGDFVTDVAALATSRTIGFRLDFDIQFTNRSTDPALS